MILKLFLAYPKISWAVHIVLKLFNKTGAQKSACPGDPWSFFLPGAGNYPDNPILGIRKGSESINNKEPFTRSRPLNLGGLSQKGVSLS